MINFFLRIWRVDSEIPAGFVPDVILALSYAVKRDRLTAGTKKVLEHAIECWKEFRGGVIAFGNCSHCYPGSEKTEERLKYEILDQAGVSRSSVISSGPIVSTVAESETISRALRERGLSPKRFLLVSGTAHSRSAMYIWGKMIRKCFPGAELKIKIIPFEYEYQKDHPLLLQRDPARWIIANIGRQLFLRVFGLSITRKIHEPSRE